MPALFAPLKHPVFRRFYLGQGISVLGDFAFVVAIAWQVLVLTGSTTQLGLVMGLYGLGQVALLLLAGVVIDRLPRRVLVVTLDLAQGVLVGILAFLSWTGVLAMWHLYVLGLAFGAAAAFAQPALSSFLPDTVPKEDIQSANSLYQATRFSSGIAGPALGAAVIALVGIPATFAFDALTFLVSAVLLATVRVEREVPIAEALGPAAPLQHPLQDLRDGFRYMLRFPWLWITVALFAFYNAVEAGPRNVLLPAYVGIQLHGGAAAVGLVQSALMAGVVAGYILPNLLPRVDRRGLVAYVGTAASGVFVLLLAYTGALWEVYVLALARGVAFATFGLQWETSVMEYVDESMRGRVFSLDMFGSFALVPISMAAIGFLADILSIQTVFFWSGVSMILLSLVGLLYPPAHRFGPAGVEAPAEPEAEPEASSLPAP